MLIKLGPRDKFTKPYLIIKIRIHWLYTCLIYVYEKDFNY